VLVGSIMICRMSYTRIVNLDEQIGTRTVRLTLSTFKKEILTCCNRHVLSKMSQGRYHGFELFLFIGVLKKKHEIHDIKWTPPY
jgi:hypothetical protein